MGAMQAGPGRGASARFSRWVSVSTIGFGAVATATGLVLLLQPSGSASIGWFAYQPLSDTIFLSPGVLLTPQNQTGTVLLIVGLASLAFGAGWALGLRQAGGMRASPHKGSPDA